MIKTIFSSWLIELCDFSWQLRYARLYYEGLYPFGVSPAKKYSCVETLIDKLVGGKEAEEECS